jgi:hypothetical protein
MTNALASRRFFAAIALLFVSAMLMQGWLGHEAIAPTGLILDKGALPNAAPAVAGPETKTPDKVALGPTLPPPPYDERPVTVALGPTLPPPPYDERPVTVALGPTLPPPPYDERPVTAV